MLFSQQYDIRLPGLIFMGLSVVILFLLILLVSRRRLTAVKELIFLYLSLFIWAVGAIFESGSMTTELRITWSQVAYFGTVFAPVLLFLFTQAYARVKLIHSTWRISLLFVLPVIYLVLALTNDRHHLVWPSVTIQPETNLAVYEHGIAFWVFFAYSYILIVSSWIMLMVTLIKYNRHFRGQAVTILLAVVFSVAGNILYLLPGNPVPGMEWTLIGIIISVILLTYDIFRLRLFDLVPTARKRLMDIMDEGMLFIDHQERILDMNVTFMEALRLPEESDFIGKSLAKVLPNQPDLCKLMTFSLTREQPVKTELILNNTDYTVNIHPVGSRASQATGRLLIINDISSLKEVETNLFAMNQQLQAELEMKQELIDELDTYAHTVAHDLKSPVGQIAGFSELIQDEVECGDLDKIRKYSKIINESSLNLVHIIDELLLLALVRSSEINKTTVTVVQCFEGAVKRLQGEIRLSGAVIHEPKEWIPVKGFQNWIQEVFVNYLSNAIKYGGNPPVIEISAWREQGMVWYSVTDNGAGIPEEMMDRLFVAYSRLETTKADGHGLGLSIVKRIVEKLGGEVGVKNAAGQGACFYFGLPDLG